MAFRGFQMSMKGNRIELCYTSKDLGPLPTCVPHAPTFTFICGGRFDVPRGTNRITSFIKRESRIRDQSFHDHYLKSNILLLRLFHEALSIVVSTSEFYGCEVTWLTQQMLNNGCFKVLVF